MEQSPRYIVKWKKKVMHKWMYSTLAEPKKDHCIWFCMWMFVYAYTYTCIKCSGNKLKIQLGIMQLSWVFREQKQEKFFHLVSFFTFWILNHENITSFKISIIKILKIIKLKQQQKNPLSREELKIKGHFTYLSSESSSLPLTIYKKKKKKRRSLVRFYYTEPPCPSVSK